MFGDKPKDVPQPFALILVPEFTMMPVTSAIEPLRLANRMSEKAPYRWTMHSVDGQPVAGDVVPLPAILASLVRVEVVLS